MHLWFRAPGFRLNQFAVKRARKPRDDFVLCRRISARSTSNRSDHRVFTVWVSISLALMRTDVAAQHAALQRISHVEIGTQLLDVDRLALEGECTAGGDHSRAAQPR